MSPSVPRWAIDRAAALTAEASDGDTFNADYIYHNIGSGAFPIFTAFAAYIAAHEEPPIDPLLIEARRIVSCAKSGRYSPSEEKAIDEGRYDNQEPIQVALTCLKRGMELAKEQSS